MRVTKNQEIRITSLLLLLILGLSFVTVFSSLKAHASYTPTVANAANNGCGTCTSTVITTTIFQAGDVIAVMAQTVNNADGTLYTIASVTSAAVSGGFTSVVSSQGTCVISAGFCGGVGANEPFYAQLWVGVATTSGAGQTITVTASQQVNAVLAGESFDIAYVATTPTTITAACNAVKNSDCGSPMGTAGLTFSTGNSIEIAGAATRGAALASVFDASQYTLNAPGNGGWGGMYSNTASSVTSPTNFNMNFAGNSGLNSGFAEIGAIFGPIASATSTTTTVINTMCLGACSGGNNGTSTHFSTSMPNLFVFYTSQNTGSAAIVDNFTMKIAAVHITTNTGTLYVLTCNSGTTAPSGTNLYNCVNTAVTISNSTAANTFLHVNPQTQICASCYYAVGIMAATTASRGSGATGSGIKFYETSQVGITQYSYNPGSTTPPSSFYSNTVKTPNFFMYIHTTYTVATSTISSTTTLTGSFTSTVTTTSTSTATTIDSTFFTQNANFPFIFLLLFLPTGLFIGITKNLSGGLVGLIIGGIMMLIAIPGPTTTTIFTGIVICVVALAYMIQRAGANG
jgi:trimeric autotransporter adhesin